MHSSGQAPAWASHTPKAHPRRRPWMDASHSAAPPQNSQLNYPPSNHAKPQDHPREMRTTYHSGNRNACKSQTERKLVEAIVTTIGRRIHRFEDEPSTNSQVCRKGASTTPLSALTSLRRRRRQRGTRTLSSAALRASVALPMVPLYRVVLKSPARR